MIGLLQLQERLINSPQYSYVCYVQIGISKADMSLLIETKITMRILQLPHAAYSEESIEKGLRDIIQGSLIKL